MISQIKPSEALHSLQNILIKLFQFESADLDFGIYKILHYKKAEVENFINQLLTEKVREQLNILATVETEKLSAQVKSRKKAPTSASIWKQSGKKIRAGLKFMKKISKLKL